MKDMKGLSTIISLLIFIAGTWYIMVNFDDIKASIDKSLSKKIKSENRVYDPNKDPSSAEFRENVAKKLYGTKNYEEMTDPNMASRIYNERMNMPTQKERNEAKMKAKQQARQQAKQQARQQAGQQTRKQSKETNRIRTIKM